MTQQLYTQFSLWLTPTRLLWIRVGLAGLTLLALAITPHAAWAGCDLSGGGACGG